MKTQLINEVRNLLDPRPPFLIFRASGLNDYRRKESCADVTFDHNGQTLTREECLTIPARKHIFIRRKHIIK